MNADGGGGSKNEKKRNEQAVVEKGEFIRRLGYITSRFGNGKQKRELSLDGVSFCE